MNPNPMHEARAALALHPVRGPLSDYRIPCRKPAQDLAGDFYAVWLGVLRPRGRSRGSLNSVIFAASRGKRQSIPEPADPPEGQHDEELRGVGRRRKPASATDCERRVVCS
jgi:hypothetical protein